MPTFDSPVSLLVLVAVVAYLMGSIPFGLVITRLFGLGDVRKIGSGNIGATNVLRTGSKPAALATLLLDAGKGLVAVLLAKAWIGNDAAQIAALFAFLGHLFPVWLGFRGGKGVATFLGSVLGLAPIVGLIALGAWAFTFFVYRISSLS
ncbi:MAG: glycerol-3-phosphate 1-O-acyltransferase PlsY, partial [Silicimonas sp.]